MVLKGSCFFLAHETRCRQHWLVREFAARVSTNARQLEAGGGAPQVRRYCDYVAHRLALR